MYMTNKNKEIFMTFNFQNCINKITTRKPIFINDLTRNELIESIFNYYELDMDAKKKFIDSSRGINDKYELAEIAFKLSDDGYGNPYDCISAIYTELAEEIYIDKSIIQEKFWQVYEVASDGKGNTIESENAEDGMNKFYQPVREYYKDIQLINLHGFESAIDFCKMYTQKSQEELLEETADAFLEKGESEYQKIMNETSEKILTKTYTLKQVAELSGEKPEVIRNFCLINHLIDEDGIPTVLAICEHLINHDGLFTEEGKKKVTRAFYSVHEEERNTKTNDFGKSE